jgi:hypothetical protein
MVTTTFRFPSPGAGTSAPVVMAPNSATNCPADPLAYGYQVNLGANVQIATGGMGCQVAAGAVIGPFPTAVLVRIWLTDFHTPVFTFYSDGNHATVVGSNPYLVSIRDSFFGARGAVGSKKSPNWALDRVAFFPAGMTRPVANRPPCAAKLTHAPTFRKVVPSAPTSER